MTDLLILLILCSVGFALGREGGNATDLLVLLILCSAGFALGRATRQRPPRNYAPRTGPSEGPPPGPER